jgi:hypothetical protein
MTEISPLIPKISSFWLNAILTCQTQGPASASCWLYQALTGMNNRLPLNLSHQYFEDTVDGPYETWWTARLGLFNNSYPGPCVNVPALFLERRWGYVMWNRRRFTKIPYVTRGILSLSRPLYRPSYVSQPVPSNRMWSWIQRTRLYQQGWRGRWDGRAWWDV